MKRNFRFDRSGHNWWDASLPLVQEVLTLFHQKTGADAVVGNYGLFELKNGAPTGRIVPVDVWIHEGRFDEKLANSLVASISEVYASKGVEVIQEGSQFFTVCESEKFPVGYRMSGYYQYGMKIQPGTIMLFAWYLDEVEKINTSGNY